MKKESIFKNMISWLTAFYSKLKETKPEEIVDFQKKIQNLMTGEKSFIIILKKEIQGYFMPGKAFILSHTAGNFNSKLEVFPKVDKIDFEIFSDCIIKVKYTRNYPDHPSNIFNFYIDDILKIEKA